MYFHPIEDDHLIRAIGRACLLFCFACFFAFNASAEPAAQDDNTDDGWEYKAMIYGWLPTVSAETPTGDSLEIDLETILKNLDGIAMLAFEGRKGRWTAHTDILYFGISDDDAIDITIPLGPISIEKTIDVDVEMSAWVVNLTGRYELLETDSSHVALVAGARYFYLDLSLGIDVTNPTAAEVLVAKNLSGSDDVWDAVVGITGQHQLNDQWKMNYKFDVGGGGSDLTWEAVVAVGYDYNWGELQMGYRYTYYDFDSSFDLLSELDVYGPYIGAIWNF
jgi:hypothetical protein